MGEVPPEEALIGKTLGGCRLLEILSSDASYVVYRAEHTQLLRPAKIKILHPNLAGDPRRVALFNRIGAAVGALNLGAEDGVHFAELGNDERAWPNLAGSS